MLYLDSIMGKKEELRTRRGRTWPDLIVELWYTIFRIKDITRGKVIRFHPILEALKWCFFAGGIFMIMAPVLNLYFMAVDTIKEVSFETPIAGYLFFEPKWNFFIGILLLGLSRWYAVVQLAASRKPEFERISAERTNMQRQLLLKLGQDDDIIKGTGDEEVVE